MVELLKGRYLPSSLRWQKKEFGHTIRRVLAERKYDVIHIDLPNLIIYKGVIGDLPSLLSVNDAISLRYKRIADLERNPVYRAVYQQLQKKALGLEMTLYNDFRVVHVVSQSDAAYLVMYAGLSNIEVVPVAVDPSYLRLPMKSTGSCERIVFTSGSLHLSYIRDPLCRFVRHYWSELRRKHSKPRFVIVGGNAPRKTSSWLKQIEGVEYYEWVEDYADTLSAADIAVFFDKAGTGTKNRVVQAMAAGKAVIGTKIAFEGIEARHGIEVFVADDLSKMFEYVDLLLGSPMLRIEMGLAARELVREKHAPELIGRRWETVYQRCAEVSR
jgi:glycosyltransferase involved in cell wall biosynthesis